jgi:NAD(P) transhydrogenase subunit alpha
MLDLQSLSQQVARLNSVLQEASSDLSNIENLLKHTVQTQGVGQADSFVIGLMVFVLACFIGYYVVWKVTPALHSPLMAVTNAISSVIIVGALIAAGPSLVNMASTPTAGISSTFGFIAVILASINIFGGFIVTQRMLSMFSKKK